MFMGNQSCSDYLSYVNNYIGVASFDTLLLKLLLIHPRQKYIINHFVITRYLFPEILICQWKVAKNPGIPLCLIFVVYGMNTYSWWKRMTLTHQRVPKSSHHPLPGFLQTCPMCNVVGPFGETCFHVFPPYHPPIRGCWTRTHGKLICIFLYFKCKTFAWKKFLVGIVMERKC